MNKHTPGPWTAEYLSHDEFVTNTSIVGSNRVVVLDMTVHRDTEQEQDANMALIAAAPDLLAALRMLEEAASGHVPVANSWVAAVARAAIAKATGSQE